jgi:hypothetical protein
MHKRPADSFGRHSASPPVPARPARLGVGRREGGGKSPPTHGRVPYRRGQGQAYESRSLHAWISCSGEAAAGRVRPARPGRPSPPAAGSPDAAAPGPRGAR